MKSIATLVSKRNARNLVHCNKRTLAHINETALRTFFAKDLKVVERENLHKKPAANHEYVFGAI